MSDATDFLAGLQGRIMALEFMVRGFIVDEFREYVEPAQALDRYRTTIYQALQHLERPPGDYPDQCWSEMIKALDEQFAQATMRLQNIVSKPPE